MTSIPGNPPPASPGSSNSPLQSPRSRMLTRSFEQRPCIKLTVNLLQTYLKINKAHSAQRKKKQEDKNYQVRRAELLAGRYVVQSVIGKGSFGRVVRAFDTQDQEDVAIKIIKSKRSYYRQSQIEVQVLQSLQDADQHNVVKLKDAFVHRNHQCIVFELLSLNLFEVLKQTRFRGFACNFIIKFGHQLLVALQYLGTPTTKRPGILHCDLKPENILLVNPKRSSIKVADFGSACFSKAKEEYKYMQSRFYRAPEIILGHACKASIDMWSLGCVLVELYTGKPLFDGKDEGDQIMKHVEVLGMPPAVMLASSSRQTQYFDCLSREDYECIIEKRKKEGKSIWWVRSGPKVFQGGCNLLESLEGSFIQNHCYWLPKSGYLNLYRRRDLKDIIRQKEGDSPAQCKHFLDFVLRALRFTPEQRMTASEGLQHPFCSSVFLEKSSSRSVAKDQWSSSSPSRGCPQFSAANSRKNTQSISTQTESAPLSQPNLSTEHAENCQCSPIFEPPNATTRDHMYSEFGTLPPFGVLPNGGKLEDSPKLHSVASSAISSSNYLTCSTSSDNSTNNSDAMLNGDHELGEFFKTTARPPAAADHQPSQFQQ